MSITTDPSPATTAPPAVDDAAADLIFRTARSATAFADEPVPDQQVRALYELMKWGPTALNSTPLRITLVRSGEARARLVRHMAGGNQARTAAAPLVAVLTADRDFHRTLTDLVPHDPGVADRFAAAGRAGRESGIRR